MPRMNILNTRPVRNLPPAAAAAPAPAPAPLSATPAPPNRSSTYPSHCFYCTCLVTSDGHRSRHVAATPACKASEDAAVSQHQRRRAECRGAEGLDLRTEARRCVPAEIATPEVTLRVPKRRRTDEVPNPTAEQARLHTDNHPPPPNLEPLPACAEAPLVEPASVRNGRAGRAPPPIARTGSGSMPQSFAETRGARNCQQRRGRHGFFVEHFPDPTAGKPITEERMAPVDLKTYMRSCGAMANPTNLETAELLMTTGLKDSGKDRHLKSSLYQGHTPWKNVDALHADLDKLPHGPGWDIQDIIIMDGSQNARVQFLLVRPLISVIREMVANPAFKDRMKWAPERHYTSHDKKNRVYSNMWTSDWWWRMQERLGSKTGPATGLPLIVATDQTVVSEVCGGQKAYPVYVTLGNISKSTRRKPKKRATMLLGYLPVDAFEDVENDDQRRRMKADLIHRSMEAMLEPLKEASENGVDMWCADGRLRRVYPTVAAYIADWPEQNLMACTSEGSCPICATKWAGRGDGARSAPLRDRDETLDAIHAYFDYNSKRELVGLGLKPVRPWWSDIPHVNLASCITPDLLHQLYQGIFKTHVVRWLQFLVGVRKLDQRFASTTQPEGVTHFPKGISHVKQWTGRESKEMLKQILPLVIGDITPEQAQLMSSVIDFIFRAHSASMTDTDLDELDAALDTLHRLKKVMVEKGFYESEKRFDRIPKLHMLGHYSHSIRELGTPDGYNSEAPEHLHIEYAKEPWRASNKVRPTLQMVQYLRRHEALRIHRLYMDEWLGVDSGGGLNTQDEEDEDIELGGMVDEVDEVDEAEEEEAEETVEVGCGNRDIAEGTRDDEEPCSDVTHYPDPRRHMAKYPTKPNLRVKDVIEDYGASELISATKDFMTNRLQVPQHDALISTHNRISVWHRLYLHHQRLPFAPFESLRRDVVRASPPGPSGLGRPPKAGVGDTALYLEKPNRRGANRNDPEKHGIHRYRVGRVRAFFTLPAHIRHHHPAQLAYLELFVPFDTGISPIHGLHSTRSDFSSSDKRRVLVVPVTDIYLACHLSPKFHLLDRDLRLTWQTDLFALSKHFWFNQYYTHYLYLLLQHWRRQPRPSVLLTRLLSYTRNPYASGSQSAS